jgi:transposase, IS5 family
MRKLIEKQLKIGQVDICNIPVDLYCRDEIPQILLGLQAIYSNKAVRDQVFSILSEIIPKNVDTKNGRPGMDLWKILVLGVIRLNCNWDFDKVHDIANNHKLIREFMGHTIFEFDQRYGLQTIKDNLSLFTPEVLGRINRVVVEHGHTIVGHCEGDALKGRCDSFVVETDVHFPTDINLLYDATRKVIELTGKLCDIIGISEWRQHRHLLANIKRLFNIANRLKHSTSKDEKKKALREQQIVDAHRNYIELVEVYLDRARTTLSIITDMGMANIGLSMLIERFMAHADRQIDQIRRRVLNDEKIPHAEKVFSIFEEHTEWISKGKAGVPQELGLKVCILEDQHGFILHHHVMENQTDDQVAVQMVDASKEKFPRLKACSFDKGFHSPNNQRDLRQRLDHVVLPRKGKLSVQNREIEKSAGFVASRKQHAAVESAINALENHGLDRCRDHGFHGFKRYVALAVLSRNIQKIGAAIREKVVKRIKRQNRSKSDLLLAA